MPVRKLRPSFTFDQDRLDQLCAIVPEAFADGKINWEVLKEALGEHLEDEDAEHFGLFWPGKREARRLASRPSKGTLVPQPGLGVKEEHTRNLFIEGDNLEVLKLLLKSYAGRVKMIYIDPPYNTGNDFIYPDDYSEPLDAYLRRTGQADEAGQLLTTNTHTSGRFHSDWLSMMYPRLLLARQLLREDGVVFVSIDDNEMHNLREMMNELFGEENFIAQFVIQSNPRGSQSIKQVANVHEYLVVFTRNSSYFEMPGFGLDESMRAGYKYTHNDGRNYRLLGLRQRGGAWRREDRPSLFFPIWVDPSSGHVALEKNDNFTIEVWPIKPTTGEDGSWRWSKRKVQKNSELLIGRQINRAGEDNAWDIYQMDFLQQPDGKERRTKAKTIWMDKELNYQNGRTELKELFNGQDVFDFPTPTFLIKQILRTLKNDDGDIILDFFAGSGTAAHAVLDLSRRDEVKRQFVLVQLPEPTPENSLAREAGYQNIADIGRERIRRVIDQIKAETKGQLDLYPDEDLGFKSYRLDRSNFKEWQDYEGDDTSRLATLFDRFESSLVADWQPEALLSEILLIEGFPLDSRVELQDHFAANQIHLVTSDFHQHRLFVCLDDTVVPETVAQLDLQDQDVFVCLDTALTDEIKVRLSDTGNIHVI
jgi:adenine-specific DNA-methyltransferase